MLIQISIIASDAIIMIKTENFEKVEVCSQEELRSWLEENYKQKDSIWLVTYMKSTPSKYVSKEQILDEVLCFGWIDGIRRKFDSERTMQLISPRKQQYWAKTYKDRVAKLIKEGKMTPAGQQTIDISKANGTWSFYDDVDALIIPDDLKIKLKSKPAAFDFFDAINPSSKRFALRWLKLAKTDATRQKRIDHLFEISLKGEKLKGS